MDEDYEEEGRLTALDRLEGLLDAKDRELAEARAKVDELEGRLRSAELGWAMPVELPEHADAAARLPVPRLEIA